VIISRLIEFLETRASLRLAVILVMAIIPMNALLIPLINQEITQESGLSRIDNQFFFTPTQLFEHIRAYGQAGRQIYLFSIAAVDFLYPILYALLFSFLLTLILRAGFAPENPLRRMQLFPFGMLVFNYLENVSIALILLVFPTQPTLLGWIASGTTTLKWCFGTFSALALLIGIGRLFVVFSKTNRSPGA
jgi:hypothetical protein